MRFLLFAAAAAICLVVLVKAAGEPEPGKTPVSDATQDCITCHETVSPGIVAAWRKSRHAKITPAAALKKSELQRRVSSARIPENLQKTSVGCAECHNLDPEKHADSFDHNEYKVHTVVSPPDCGTCHAQEVTQYGDNIMAHAYGNLKNNPVFQSLADSINTLRPHREGKTGEDAAHPLTEADSCLVCHGTKIEVRGTKQRETEQGEMEFPVLSGWPNQGTGRINPDGSMGACTPCHARHQFSIEMARKPHTCSQCHKGPDVPAFKVYQVSKHGNIYSSISGKWDFESVPWKAGEDFTAPTCASCHVSLVVGGDGEVISKRTHTMNDRLGWRLFGLIYAHAHPLSPDTSGIKNKAGLPLPTELTGEPAKEYLISAEEMEKRDKAMRKTCSPCHGGEWVDGHFMRLRNTVRTTNRATLAATKVIVRAWEEGAAKGLAQNESIFDEAIEKKWVEQWLFYANSVRFASAMAGADYGVFANGRWYMSKNLAELNDYLELKKPPKKPKEK